MLTRAQLSPQELHADHEQLRRLARSNLLDGSEPCWEEEDDAGEARQD